MNNKSKIQSRYDVANTVQVKMKLNRKTDVDILSKLEEVANKQGYSKALIRKDIQKDGLFGTERS